MFTTEMVCSPFRSPLPILSTIRHTVFTARGLSPRHDEGPRINNHSVSRGRNIFFFARIIRKVNINARN